MNDYDMTEQTPDAEPVASVPRRALALAVDNVLVLVSVTSLLILAGDLIGADAYEIGYLLGFFFVVSVPALALYWALLFASMQWVFHGRTPGKALLGIAVRNAADGRRPRLGQLLARELMRMLLMLLLVVPFVLDGLAAFRNPRKQTWHDRSAGTVVLRVGYGWLAPQRQKSLRQLSRPTS